MTNALTNIETSFEFDSITSFKSILNVLNNYKYLTETNKYHSYSDFTIRINCREN